MKKYRVFLFFSVLLFSAALLTPACSQKSGCPANESLRPPVNKKGEIKSKGRGQSGLFPKKMSKRMKK